MQVAPIYGESSEMNPSSYAQMSYQAQATIIITLAWCVDSSWITCNGLIFVMRIWMTEQKKYNIASYFQGSEGWWNDLDFQKHLFWEHNRVRNRCCMRKSSCFVISLFHYHILLRPSMGKSNVTFVLGTLESREARGQEFLPPNPQGCLEDNFCTSQFSRVHRGQCHGSQELGIASCHLGERQDSQKTPAEEATCKRD